MSGMAESYRIDAKSKTLKENKAGDQIPYGDSVISADHLEKCTKKNSKSEASIITKLGISDKRAAKAKA
jgi:hypothetical protein